jgi:uncharacterized protein (TIGR04255 family)
MAEYRHLNNAPIKEALIDLRVKLPPDFNVKRFEPAKGILRKRFPKCKERRAFKGGFGMEDGRPIVETPIDLGVDGYIFTSSDEKKTVQFRKDGFTYNRLKPYTSWEDVLSEAKELWQLYVESSGAQIITRIAVRYINDLKIPLPIRDFSDYLTVPPRIPDNIPQLCRSFFSRVVVHDTSREIDANIIQSLETGAGPEFATIIIDIDVYKRMELDTVRDEIWQVFEQLRDLKNNIFFGSITEETARMFE